MEWKKFDYEKPAVGQEVLVCGRLYKAPKIARRMQEPKMLPHGRLAFFIDEWSCVLVNVEWWMPLPPIPISPGTPTEPEQDYDEYELGLTVCGFYYIDDNDAPDRIKGNIPHRVFCNKGCLGLIYRDANGVETLRTSIDITFGTPVRVRFKR